MGLGQIAGARILENLLTGIQSGQEGRAAGAYKKQQDALKSALEHEKLRREFPTYGEKAWDVADINPATLDTLKELSGHPTAQEHESAAAEKASAARRNDRYTPVDQASKKVQTSYNNERMQVAQIYKAALDAREDPGAYYGRYLPEEQRKAFDTLTDMDPNSEEYGRGLSYIENAAKQSPILGAALASWKADPKGMQESWRALGGKEKQDSTASPILDFFNGFIGISPESRS